MNAKERAKAVLTALVLLWVTALVVMWVVEKTNPDSDTNTRLDRCVAQVEESGLDWTDTPAYGDAIDDCVARG